VSDPYAAVWRAALPYLRARKNDVHVPLSYGYAEELLARHPSADRDVVLLGILLHDVGWAIVDQEAILREGFGPGMMESDVRIAHEKEGARLAREILERLGYPADTVEHVVAIVDGHDTRRHAISPEDELVKDADKLWRFTVTGVCVSSEWFGMTPDVYVEERLVGEVLGQLFTPAAIEIAQRELAATRRLLRLDVLSADIYERIYAAAEPYWATRDNDVHVPEAYALCRTLLRWFPEADEAVVLPAILLHDVGYLEVPEDEQRVGLHDLEVARRHEIAGARIAGEILRGLGYDEERTRRIQEIVDGHDTRPEPLSLEETVVREADRLWRFTENGIRFGTAWRFPSDAETIAFFESKLDEWMLTEPGKRLAREALARSKAALLVAEGVD